MIEFDQYQLKEEGIEIYILRHNIMYCFRGGGGGAVETFSCFTGASLIVKALLSHEHFDPVYLDQILFWCVYICH